MADVTRIEWPADSPFVLLPQTDAKTMVRLGYAVGITDDQMKAYNDFIEENAGKKEPPLVPVVAPVAGTQEDATIVAGTSSPPIPETASEPPSQSANPPVDDATKDADNTGVDGGTKVVPKTK